jgi:hypothetical protein
MTHPLGRGEHGGRGRREGLIDPRGRRQGRRERDPAGEPLGVSVVGGAQDLDALLPLRLGQAAMDIVGRHQAEGAVTMLGVDQVKNRWQNASASSYEPNRAGKSGRYLSVLNCASENGLSLETCGRA